jgi:methyl-accepting chemotaxis protein
MLNVKFRIKNKLLILVICTTALVFGAFLITTSKIFDHQSKEQSILIVQSETQKYAELTKNYFDLDMGYVKALANSIQYTGTLNQNERDSVYGHQMLQMLSMNPKYISVWASMELQFYQDNYEKDYGRKLLVAMRQGSGNIITEFYRDMEGRDPNSDYTTIRKNDEPVLAEPYIDKDISQEYITSIIYPVHINGMFAGLGGIDVPLSDMQKFINQMNLKEGSVAYIISNGGLILGHSDTTVLGKNIAEVYPDLVKANNIIEKIHSGELNGFQYKIGDKVYYASVVPFLVAGTSTPWAISISRPLDIVLQEGRRQMIKLLLLGALGLTLLFSIIIIYARSIARPLKTANKVFAELAKGNIDENLRLHKTSTGDSLEELAESVNSLIDSLHKTENYALEIEKGNLDAEFTALGEKDRLGHALIMMGESLREARQKFDDIRSEEEKSRWISDGLAKFALLMRTDATNYKEFCRTIISELVQYTNAHQGGIYLINSSNEKDKFIELAGSYAFDANKNIKTRIEMGEGLIGTSIVEGQFKHLKDIPGDYLKVASGLGEVKPADVVIIPLINNKNILGCLELGNLSTFEDYHIEFLKSVGESIAAAFASLELHNKTNILLEKTQQQAEEMMAQEEQLRQNMEEMMANQEEMMRKEEEYLETIKDLQKNLTNQLN